MKIKPSITSYIDGEFYINEMDEAKKGADDFEEARNYPVKVEAMRCNWILGTDGKKFFSQILKSESLDIYSIPAIQMFIEYLYILVKQKVIAWRLIAYLFQVVIYYGLIYIYEAQFKTVQDPATNTLQLQMHDVNSSGAGFWANVFSIANIVASLYPFYFIML